MCYCLNISFDDEVSKREWNIISIWANQMTLKKCYVAILRIGKVKKETKPKSQLVACTSLNNNLGDAKLDPQEEKLRAEPT